MSAMTQLIAGALPSSAPGTAPALRRAGTGVRTRPHRPGRPHLIDEALFKDALGKERKRAERFDQPFMLILVGVKENARPQPTQWIRVIDALRAVTTGTDVLGWFDKRKVMGVIVPEIGTEPAARRAVYKKIRRELHGRMKFDALLDEFSVRLHVHEGAKAAAPAPADPVPFDLQHAQSTTPLRDALKRGLDIIGSAALLTMLLPVYAVVAAFVKLTSTGPVFFGQERIGRMGRPFKMLKFRTMHVNADPAIHQKYVSDFIASGGRASQPDKTEIFKIVNDPRVTPVGHVLRKTSLDELPQFWNVLRGEMSLVGPRPPLSYEVAQYKPWHYRRVVEAKPGITGLWQVTGRSRTTFDDMVRLDLRYAKTHSVWTDVKILLATPRAVISGKGAC
jgi:lipopolysaccharide/colanic/teichoic acid biosynthesis glycosyltransferase